MATVLNGLVYGCLLVILSSGLVLIFGLRQVINFAHGSFYAIGAYVGFTVAPYVGFWLAMVTATGVLAIIGWALDRWCFRPLQDRPPLTPLIITFGLYLMIEDIIGIIWGRDTYSLATPAMADFSVWIFGERFPFYRLIIISVGLVTAAGVQAWLRLSRIGLYARAASTNRLATGMQGVNTDFVSGLVVALGCGLAGMAGVIAAPMLSLSPTMGSIVVTDCFVVLVIGGLGSFGGAFVAALALGMIQSFGATYVPQIASLIPYLLMAGVLIWRPTGFAGSRIH
jgi:branched-chain amino acid transport system permease protein